MAIALVSSTIVNSTSGGGSGSITSTAIDTTGASVIILAIASFGGAALVTDSASNTWVQLPLLTGSSSVVLQVFYCFNPTTSATHTFTYPGASGVYPSMNVAAFSGTGTLTPPDIVISDSGTVSGTNHTPGTLNPATNNGLLLALYALNNSNYSSIDSSFSTTNTHSHDASSVGNVFGYQIQTTATSRTPTITTTVSNSQYATYGISIAAPQATAPSLISHTSAQSSNGNNITTGAINTSGASLIVLEVGYVNGTQPTISDSAGNTWTALTSAGTKIVFLYCINPITSSTHTFTASLTSSKPTLAAAAFSGTTSFDVQANSNSNISTITPTNTNSLIVTGVGISNSNALTPGTNDGFVLLETQINATNAVGLGLAYKIQPSNVSTSTQWNSNDASRSSVIATFNNNTTLQLTETASDTLSLGDALSIDAPIPVVSLSDSLNLSDTVNLMYGLIISDGFTLADLFDFGLSLPLSISGDSLSLLDAVIFLIGVGIGKSDVFTVSDVLKIAAQTSRVLGDNILLSDFLVALITQLPSYSDNFNLSDSANLILSLGITQSDSLLLSDAVQLAISNVLTLVKSDSLNLSDSLIIDTPSPLDQYVRHWLNDVPR